MSLLCRICSTSLPDDSPSPFCYPCWDSALHKKDTDSADAILRWIVEPEDE